MLNQKKFEPPVAPAEAKAILAAAMQKTPTSNNAKIALVLDQKVYAILASILMAVSTDTAAVVLQKSGSASMEALVSALDFSNVAACGHCIGTNCANDNHLDAQAGKGPVVGIRAAAKYLDLSVSTYYELISEHGPRFDPHCPKPIKMTDRRGVIRVSSLDAYINFKASKKNGAV